MGPPSDLAADAPSESASPNTRRPAETILLGIALVVTILIAGGGSLDAPWIHGAEWSVLVENPAVNPRADGVPNTNDLSARLVHVFTRQSDDLYQPIPVASYTLEWSATGGSAGSVRRTDLLLHTLNALLLWAVFAALIRTTIADTTLARRLAWALAAIWALHPALAATYAADAGRPLLLAATFGLLTLACYLRALRAATIPWALSAATLLSATLLCQPAPGWLLVIIALETQRRGLRAALRTPRLWIVVCAGVATTGLTLAMTDGVSNATSAGRFGDPVASVLSAIWIYARNLIAPAWLSVQYLPDPRTGWLHPPVWGGLAIAAVALGHAIWAWRRPSTRLATAGWIWCAALLAPTIGTANTSRALSDRDLYLPLLGILLVAGVNLAHVTAARRRLKQLVVPVAGLVAILFVLQTLPQARIVRSTPARAEQLVTRNPGDPRALDLLAAAYEFARSHPIAAWQRPLLPSDTPPDRHFTARLLDTLRAAASSPDLERYYPAPSERGAFHQRISQRLLAAGDAQAALAEARAARELLPDEFGVWRQLAGCHRALGQLEDAARAYEACEARLPDNQRSQAVHYTEFAWLLMFDLHRDDAACPRFERAIDTGVAPLAARIGLAACHIRYGEGIDGFTMISGVLAEDPGNVAAGLILAEYHLRSHHLDQARQVYAAILQDHPAVYAALRGFHEVCLQLGRYGEAVSAWDRATAIRPESRAFASYRVWALAIAGAPEADSAADRILEIEPTNPLACLAKMLLRARQDAPPRAGRWLRIALRGEPIREARSFARAAATLRLLRGREELPDGAGVLDAAIRYITSPSQSDQQVAEEELRGWREADQPGWSDLAAEILGELSDPETVPAP